MNKIKFDLQFFGWDDVNNESGGEKAKVEFASFDSGKATEIRVLDKEPFSRWAHWMASIKRSLTCPGKDCPICNIIKEQKANGETPKYASSKRHSILIWNYSTNRIEMFEGGNEVFGQLAVFKDNVGELSTYTLKVIKSGKGKDTKYQFIPQPPSPVSTDVVKAYEEFVTGFDAKDYYKAFTYEQMVMVIQGKTLEEIFANQEEAETGEVAKEENMSFEVE